MSRNRSHRIADPEVGDKLFVVTALPPARGFINEQDFIEFRALASTQGVVIEPLADDINVDLAADKVVDRPPVRPDAVDARCRLCCTAAACGR